jgi:hypothetical protein
LAEVTAWRNSAGLGLNAPGADFLDRYFVNKRGEENMWPYVLRGRDGR